MLADELPSLTVPGGPAVSSTFGSSRTNHSPFHSSLVHQSGSLEASRAALNLDAVSPSEPDNFAEPGSPAVPTANPPVFETDDSLKARASLTAAERSWGSVVRWMTSETVSTLLMTQRTKAIR